MSTSSKVKVQASPAAKAGKAAVAQGGGANKPAAEDDSGGVLRWLVGWLVIPGLFVLALFGAGVLFGVHFHDAWFTRQVVRVVHLFGG